MMTRKDYIRAAAIVRQVRLLSKHDADVLERYFCRFFAEDNPRFEHERFHEACTPRPN